MLDDAEEAALIARLGNFAGDLVLVEHVPPEDLVRNLVLCAASLYTRYVCNDQQAAAAHLREIFDDLEAAAVERDPTLRTVN